MKSYVVLAYACLLLAVVTSTGCNFGNDAAHADPPRRGRYQVAAADDEQQVGGTKTPKVDEVLFEGWPKPDVAVVITGRQHGYIEPCGCTGLENQLGGLMRRHTFLNKLKSDGWNVLPIDSGNQVRRFGRQPEIKFQQTVEALKAMHYRAVAFGVDDLKLSSEHVLSIAGNLNGDSPFVSANVAILDESLSESIAIVESGGKKIGITSFLGKERQKHIQSADVIMKSPEEGVQSAWEKLKAANCDFTILMAQSSLDESREIAKRFPGFNVVVTAGGPGEPTAQPERIPGSKTVMVQTGKKGMYAGVIGIYFDQAQRVRYQRVPLDSRFVDSQEMLQLFARYQAELKREGFKGLGLTPIAHPSGHRFVGSKVCQDCHETEYEIWHDGIAGLDKGGPHTHATESLVHPPNSRSQIPRHFDPECLSCHVTGWHASGYYPYVSGYLELEKSKHLHTNGCENCHGPGSAHVAAENDGADDAVLTKLRKELHMSLKGAEEKCMTCHDVDNSPAFHKDKEAFKTYWKRVAHGPSTNQ